MKHFFTKDSLNTRVLRVAQELADYDVHTTVLTKDGCMYPSVDSERLHLLTDAVHKFITDFTKLGKAKLLYPQTINTAVKTAAGLIGYDKVISIMKTI
jgi:hypothetical protein